ncbi:MAG TPA: hypothetical protein VH482_08390, partial [Thermomicrobiales bacterium]
SSLQSDPVLPAFIEMFREEDGQVRWDMVAQEVLNQGGRGLTDTTGLITADDNATRADKIATTEEEYLTNLGNLSAAYAELYEKLKTAQQHENTAQAQWLGPFGGFSDDVVTGLMGAYATRSLLSGTRLGGALGKAGGSIVGGIGRIFGRGGASSATPFAESSVMSNVAGRGVAGVGLGLAGWGADEALGHYGVETNGAFGTIGTMAGLGLMVGGPWGAAIGAGVGAGIVGWQNREAIGDWMGEHGMGGDDLKGYGEAAIAKVKDVFGMIGDLSWGDLGEAAKVALAIIFPPFSLLQQLDWGSIGSSARDALGAIVGGLVDVKDWTVGFFEDRWDDLTGVGSALVDWIVGLPGTVIGGAGDVLKKASGLQNTVLNALIVDPLNGLIGALSGLKIDIPGGGHLGIPASISLPDLPQIPRFARGTADAPAGWAWVGEQGPELRWLNQGDRILDAADSRRFSQTVREARASDTIAGRGLSLADGPVVLDSMASRAIAGHQSTQRIEIRELRVNIYGGTIDEQMKNTLVRETAHAVVRDLGELLGD